MKKRFSSTIIGIVVLLFFIKANIASAQIAYTLSINEVVKNDTLYLGISVTRASGSTAFAFGNSSFVINVDTSLFDLSKATIVPATYTWSNNSNYQNLLLSYSNQYQEINLGILKKTTGASGVTVPVGTTLIGALAIPIKNCTSGTSLTWRQVFPATIVQDWNGTDITSYATFNNPGALPSLCDPSMTTTVRPFPNDTICKGETVKFVATVSSSYDKINFYRNDTLVQSGTSNVYTLTNPINGTRIYATAVRCACTATSPQIKLVVDNINVNLGADQRLCKNPITLNAGAFPAGIKYLWNTGATTSSISVSAAGTYSVMVYRPGGCYAMDTVVVYPRLTMGTPYPAVGTVTGTSIQFTWNSDANATTYQYSTDSITWTSSATFSHTISGLSTNTSKCLWVRFINYCDTMVSQKVCGTTASGCKVVYTKPKDSALCSAATVNIKLTNINPPNYQIYWNGSGISTTTATYSVLVNKDTTITFRVEDPGIAGCYVDDSVHFNYVPVNDAGFSGLNTSYCITASTSILTPNQSGGVFTGAGVGYNYTSDQWYFKPGSAGAGTHTITYTICNLSSSKNTVVSSDTCLSSVVSDSSASAITAPQGLYTDCDGNIYVSSNTNNIITKIDSLGNATIVVGDSSQVGGYASGSVAVARINSPIGVTVGPDGTVYFVDSGNQMVRMVKNGVVYDIAGVQGVAAATKPSGTISPGTSAKFNKPYGIALNSTGTKLYVSDQTYGQIREIDLTVPGYSVSVLAGGGSSNINNPAGIAPLTADMVQPSHLTIDNNYLYITDAATEAVYVYQFSTGLIKPYAGKYNQVGNALGDTSVATLNSPSGISVNCNGSLFVVDQNNNSVKLVDPNNFSPSIHVLNFAGANSPGGQGSALSPLSGKIFKLPTAVSTFVKGYIDIADTGNNRILRLSMGAYAPQPWKDFQQDFTYCAYDKADTLTPPCNGVYSGAGIVHSGGITKFDPSVAGAGIHTITYTYTSGYCVETDTKSITVYAKPAPQFLADSMICSNQFSSYQLDAGSGFTTYAWYKNGVLDPGVTIQYYTVKATGTYKVTVTNTGGCIGSATIKMQTKPSPTASITSTSDSLCYGGSSLLTTSGSIASPYTITSYVWNTGSTGNSLIVSASADYKVSVTASNGCQASATHRITERDAINICMSAATPSGTDLGYGKYTQSVFAGKGVVGNGNYNFSSPNGLYYDQTTGYLYVTEDGSANDIRRIKISDTTISLYAGVSGPGGFNNGTLLTSKFSSPYGVVKLSNGKFVLADSSNEVIRLLDPLNVSNLAGNTSTIGYKDGVNTSARFNAPYGIVTGTLGNIYVTDYNNNKIRKITSSGVVTTIAGDSSSAAASGLTNGVSYASRFYHPAGIAFDTEGNLYVADAGNNVIRKITRDTIVSTFASGFSNPGNMAIDSKGNIFLSDVGSKSIKKIDKYGVITTIATGVGNPAGISIDPITERIYFAEKDSSRISTLIKNKKVVICQGDSVSINATCSNGSSYQWTPSFDLTNVSSGKVIVYPDSTTTYYLTVTNASGCSNVDSITIFVNPKPVAKAGTDTTFCFVGSKKLGALPVARKVYSWTASPSANSGLSNNNTSNPVATPTLAGTYSYYLKVRDTITGCINRDTAVVKVNPKPTANAGKDTSVCEGKSVQLNAANPGGLTFKWSPNTWLSSDVISNPVSTPLATITYELIVKNAYLCSDTDSVVVVFNPKPFANAGTDTTLCLGASKQLGTTNVAGNTYQWTASPAANSGLSSTTIYNPTATPAAVNTFKYLLTVTDSKGCQNKDSAQIIVNAVPVHTSLQKVSFCIGDTTVINAPAGPYTYLWTPKYGMRLSDTSKVSAHISPSIDTTYIVKVTLGSCFDRDTVKVKVNPLPVVNAGTDTIMCLGGTKKLGVNPVSKATYQWSVLPLSKAAYAGLSQNNISNPTTTPTDSSAYTFTVLMTDSNGCKNSDNALITVKGLPTRTPLEKDTICWGDSVTIGPAANGYGFSWSPSKGLSSTTIANPKASPKNDTLYIATISLTYPGGPTCYNKDSVFVKVNPKPVANAGKDTSVCEGKSVQLIAANPGGLTFKWTPNTWLSSDVVYNPISTPLDTITYTLIVKTAYQCSDTDSVVVIFNPKPFAGAGTDTTFCLGGSKQLGTTYVAGNTYQWTTSPVANAGLSSSTIYNPVATPTLSGSAPYTYTLTVTDIKGCQNTSTAMIKVDSVPVHNPIKQVPVCIKDSVIISGPSAPAGFAYTYLWAPKYGMRLSDTINISSKVSPSIDTTYIVKVTLGSCVDKDTIKVKVNPLPVPNAGTDTVMCLGGTKQLGTSAIPKATYQWSVYVLPVAKVANAGLSSNNIYNPSVTPTDSAEYYFIVTLTDSNACKNSDSALVAVRGLPTLTPLERDTLCRGDSITIGPAGNGYGFSWSPSKGLSSTTIANPSASPSNDTLYIATISLAYPGGPTCYNKDSVFVTVNSKPVPSFTSAIACAQDTVRFTSNSTILPPVATLTYNWEFGDGLTSAAPKPLHIYNSSGVYPVKLIVTSSKGCIDSVSVNVPVNKKPTASYTDSIACAGYVNFKDASSSNDTTSINQWYWDFNDGNTFTRQDTAHIYANAGNYNVSLVVTTTQGCKDTVYQIIPVRNLKITVANDTTVCAGTNGSLKVLANGGAPPYNYLWTTSGSGVIATPTDSVTTVKNNTAGSFKYYISVKSSANCTVKDSMKVSVVSLPLVNAGKDTSICFGKSVTLQGVSSDPNFGISNVNWTPSTGLSSTSTNTTNASPTSSITYIFSVTGNNYSCINRDTVNVTVNSLPDSVINQSSPNACAGSLVLLTLDPSNRTNKINWIDITSGNTIVDQDTIKYGVSTNGTYKVVITNPVTGCVDSSTTAPIVFVNPPSNVVVNGPDSSCINEPFLLTAVASGDSLNYKWISGGSGTFLSPTNDTTMYVPDPSDPASLSIKFIAYNTCANMPGFDTIRLNPTPLGSFSYTPAQSFAEDTVSFINASDTILYSITKWAWKFKDGDSSKLFNPQHVFAQPGIYDVEMKLVNKYGCYYIFDLPVEIYDIHVLFIPNAFSPFANNSENRTCKVYGEKISPEGFSFNIYNRWGDMVYSTSNLSEARNVGWDGTNPSKEPQSMGVFTYVVKGSWEDGKPISKTGTVTLIR